jgi:hypothetical protein
VAVAAVEFLSHRKNMLTCLISNLVSAIFLRSLVQRRSQRMNSVGSELICRVRQVVICKFTQYFNFLQHVLRGFTKKFWGQLTP